MQIVHITEKDGCDFILLFMMLTGNHYKANHVSHGLFTHPPPPGPVILRLEIPGPLGPCNTPLGMGGGGTERSRAVSAHGRGAAAQSLVKKHQRQDSRTGTGAERGCWHKHSDLTNLEQNTHGGW
jgi:hypothetical protein